MTDRAVTETMMESSSQDATTTLPAPGETDSGTGSEVYLFPMSFAQRRLWFLSRLDPETSAYNVSGGFRVHGPLDPAVLRRAFRALAERHEILRTTFSMVDGEPVQVVSPGGETDLVVVDLEGEDEEGRRRRTDSVLADVTGRPFDLVEGPLWRVAVLRESPEEHVVVHTMHHIVTDAWSEEVLLRDLSALYRSLRDGGPDGLPDLEIQYGDYAHWEAEYLQGETLDRLLGFWRDQLEGAPRVLDLPTDFPRPAVFSFEGDGEAVTLPAGFPDELAAFCQRARTTPFVVFLSALGVVLSRFARQDEMLLGAPIAHREQEETEALIGFFVNTLVLRLDLASDPSFEDLVERTRERVLAAQEHADLPFDKLVSDLDLDRDRSRNPLVQAVLNVENVRRAGTGQEEAVGDLRLSPLEAANRSAKFDLAFGAFEAPDGVRLSLEYATRLFTSGTARRLVEAFREVVLAAVADPVRRVMDLPLASEDARSAADAVARPARAAEGPSARTLWSRFAEQAERRPDAVALELDGTRVSYGELARRAGALGRRLRPHLGGAAEPRVGLLMERSTDLVVALLAVLEAGAAYVPLDPTSPRERLEFLLADSGISLLLGQRGMLELVPDGGCPVMEIGKELAAVRVSGEPEGGTEDHPAVGPDSAAYVIYTSGSTGTPKGVVISHRNVDRLLTETEGWFGFGEDDVWTLFHSHAFDFSVWEIWGALAYGGRLVVVPYWVSRAPDRFRSLLADRGVTVLDQTPSAFHQLVGADAGEEPADLAALRWVVFGGEALEVRKLAPWWSRHGDIRPRLVNMYGITETTVHVTYRELGEGDLAERTGSPLGVPIPDLGVLLLDESGRLVPPAFPGEMYVRGGGVSRGYLGRPALTAERFVPDPDPVHPGGRLYRTGDLGRLRESGELEYLGRVDDQVQVHGFRVEPGEIETALVRHPAVAEAAVIARGEGADRALVAYVVPAGGESAPGAEALRSFLADRLPSHLIPSWFLALDTLPLTGNGKLDRAALPAPGGARPSLGAEYAAPRTPLEETLAEIWSAALEVDRVGIHDSFFTLGGDSIRSLRVIGRARERGIELALEQLFRLPTIAELAMELEAASAPEPGAALSLHTQPFSLLQPEDLERLPEGLEDAYPLSGLQAGMLFHAEEMAGRPVFHNLNSHHLRLPFDGEAFERAVARVVERHPILRGSFDLVSYDEPLMLIHREVPSPLTVEDLRHLEEEAQEAVIGEYCRTELAEAFDLSQAPQLRFRIHRRTDESFQFTLTENHAILDGWSLHTLLGELLGLYLADVSDRPAPDLPPLETTFRDFVRLEREALDSDATRELWRRRLEGVEPLRVPRSGDPSRVEPGGRCLRLDRPVPADLLRRLEALAETEGVPLKSLLLASHVKVMGELAGRRDVITGLSSNGRPETEDGHRVLGLFLNTLPLRLELSDGSWLDLVRRARAEELALVPHRRFPLAEIQKLHGFDELLETSFVYLDFHVLSGIARSGQVAMEGRSSFVEETNFAVMTAFQHALGGDGLSLSMTCDRTLLSDEQIESLGGRYLVALEAMVADPEARHDELSILSEDELRRLVEEWNPEPPTDVAETILDAFRRRVEARPEAPALAVGAAGEEPDEWSYGELDRRVSRLAHHLRRHGVANGSPVGVCLDRSPEAIAAFLAVLRAGGSFVPCETSQPVERVRSLLDAAGVRAVIARPPWTGSLSTLGVPVVCLERDAGAIATEPAEDPDVAIDARQLAYVLYTSGSTGEPKGVAVEHRHLAAYVASVVDRLELTAGERYGLVSTLGADLGHTLLFGALVSGACLDIYPPERVEDPAELAAGFAARPLDGLKIVPSHLRALLDLPEPERLTPRRLLVLGGEAVDWPLVEAVRRLAPECRIYDHYGPTETTVGCAAGLLDPDERPLPPSPPLGTPLPASRLYVVDESLRPLPPGTPGELAIGGATVARGYLGDPGRTAERFVPDPWGTAPGARLYRSGDRARHLDDGRVLFLGRGDHQVKIRGFRVEPGEVAAVLLRHEAVAQAAVVADRTAETPRLLAYVVPASGRSVEEDLLRGFLGERLPEAMVPEVFVALDALPLTANGKLDRTALPAPPAVGADGERAVRHPRNLVELQLTQICEEILGKSPVGIDEDFFALGGNSLSAVRVVARVRKQLGYSLPLRTFLASPTVEGLAAIVNEERVLAEPRHLVTVHPTGSKRAFYCVHPGHGTLASYLDLARHLGTDRPFYGLQALDLDPDSDPYRSVEQLAAAYLEEVLEEQPEGPYLLGGWSFGGLVAFEMALQLVESGREVAGLALIDTRSPAANAELVAMDRDRLQTYLILEHAKQIASLSARDLPLAVEDLAGLSLDEKLDRVTAEVDLARFLPAEVDRDLLRRYFELRIARFEAIRDYVPRPYPGTLTLFRAEEVYTDTALEEAAAIFERAAADPTYGWQELTDQPLDVRRVPGNHESMVYEPHVGDLADRLDRFFDELDGGKSEEEN